MYYNIFFVLKIKDKENRIIDYLIIFYFLLGAGIIIYLIYSIPNEVIQEIITAIVASLYGGLLTLTGVLWTIKNSEKKYQNDIILNNKPLIFILNPHEQKNKIESLINFDSDKIVMDSFSCGDDYVIRNFFLENGDYSYCSIKGILINGKDKILLSNAHLIKKNTRYYVNFNELAFKYAGPIKTISVILYDVLENCYLWEIDFSIEKISKIKTIYFNNGVKIYKTGYLSK